MFSWSGNSLSRDYSGNPTIEDKNLLSITNSCSELKKFETNLPSEILNLSNLDLRCYKFDGLTLNYTDFSGAILDGSSFVGAKLRGANFTNAISRFSNFSEADLSYANMNDAKLSNSVFANAKLPGANLKGAAMDGVLAQHADFKFANISHSSLKGSNLEHADMRLSNLAVSNLGCSKIKGADFRGAEKSYVNFGFSQEREMALGLEPVDYYVRLFNDFYWDTRWTGFKYYKIGQSVIQSNFNLDYEFSGSAVTPSRGFYRSNQVDWFVDEPDGNGIFLFNRRLKNHKINLTNGGANIIIKDGDFISRCSRLYLHVFGKNTRYAVPVSFQSSKNGIKHSKLNIDPNLKWEVTYVRSGEVVDSVSDVLKNAEMIGLMLLNVNLKKLPAGHIDLMYMDLVVDEKQMNKFQNIEYKNLPEYCTNGP